MDRPICELSHQTTYDGLDVPEETDVEGQASIPYRDEGHRRVFGSDAHGASFCQVVFLLGKYGQGRMALRFWSEIYGVSPAHIIRRYGALFTSRREGAWVIKQPIPAPTSILFFR